MKYHKSLTLFLALTGCHLDAAAGSAAKAAGLLIGGVGLYHGYNVFRDSKRGPKEVLQDYVLQRVHSGKPVQIDFEYDDSPVYPKRRTFARKGSINDTAAIVKRLQELSTQDGSARIADVRFCFDDSCFDLRSISNVETFAAFLEKVDNPDAPFMDRLRASLSSPRKVETSRKAALKKLRKSGAQCRLHFTSDLVVCEEDPVLIEGKDAQDVDPYFVHKDFSVQDYFGGRPVSNLVICGPGYPKCIVLDCIKTREELKRFLDEGLFE